MVCGVPGGFLEVVSGALFWGTAALARVTGFVAVAGFVLDLTFTYCFQVAVGNDFVYFLFALAGGGPHSALEG